MKTSTIYISCLYSEDVRIFLSLFRTVNNVDVWMSREHFSFPYPTHPHPSQAHEKSCPDHFSQLGEDSRLRKPRSKRLERLRPKITFGRSTYSIFLVGTTEMGEYDPDTTMAMSRMGKLATRRRLGRQYHSTTERTRFRKSFTIALLVPHHVRGLFFYFDQEPFPGYNFFVGFSNELMNLNKSSFSFCSQFS